MRVFFLCIALSCAQFDDDLSVDRGEVAYWARLAAEDTTTTTTTTTTTVAPLAQTFGESTSQALVDTLPPTTVPSRLAHSASNTLQCVVLPLFICWLAYIIIVP